MIQHAVAVAFLSALFWSVSSGATVDTLCQGVRLGAFPHPDDCRRYVVCFQGQTNILRCPIGFVFNPTVLFCVQESQYRCNPVTTTGPPELTSTEPSSTTTESAGPECVPRPSWESFFCEDARRTFVPNPMNCTQYINCRSDPPRNNGCPPGTVFNDPYQDCLPGDDRRCSLATVNEGFCATRPDGSYAHPFLCNRFVSCVRQQVRLESCPPFYVFDPAVAYCVKGSAVTCSTLLEQ